MTCKIGHLLPQGAEHWLKHGERGTSSEAIFSHLTGIPITNRLWPPADSGDLRRCRLLLKTVPEFQVRLHEMAELPAWGDLIANWDAICAMQDAGDHEGVFRAIIRCTSGGARR